MLKGLSTFLMCSPNCSPSENFPFSSSVMCLLNVMTHFCLTIFQSVLLPRLCRLSLPTMPCVCSPLPAFGSLELDHQSSIAHSHLQKNKNKRNFPSTKSCILIKQSWCIGTSQTRWLSFPHLQKEFEEKVGNGLTELSTSWEVGLTSTCYYIWHLDVNAAHTHIHTLAVWAFWCTSNIKFFFSSFQTWVLPIDWLFFWSRRKFVFDKKPPWYIAIHNTTKQCKHIIGIQSIHMHNLHRTRIEEIHKYGCELNHKPRKRWLTKRKKAHQSWTD